MGQKPKKNAKESVESFEEVCDEKDTNDGCVSERFEVEEKSDIDVTIKRVNSEVKVVKLNEGDKLDEFHEMVDKKGFNDAVKFMYNRVLNEEQIVEITYKIFCFREEGSVALFQAVKNIMGIAEMSTVMGASGDNAPQLLNVELPDGTNIQVPWGRVGLPTFDENSYLDMNYDWEQNTLDIMGVIAKKHEAQVRSIINEAQRLVDTESIYKGKAIELEFDEGDAETPEYLNLNNIDESRILLSKEVSDGIIPIMSRIEQTGRCIEEGLDLKYGALLEGPYGTGKTLIAFLIAKLAVANGWTFIYLKDCRNIAKALKLSEIYTKTEKGVVLFSEDIDQAVGGNRNGAMQQILNTIDGGDTKGKAIISLFTTNHIELIDPTFLRGKRIGGLISFGALDKETALKFLTKLVVDKNGKSLLEKENIEAAAEALVGIVPAFASEVIDKSKAYMIKRGGRLISADDIIVAANSYKRQIGFAKMKKVDNEEAKLKTAIERVFDIGIKRAPSNDVSGG